MADAYPDHRYRCVVDEIAPEANRQKATVQVKVKVLDPDGRMRPEMNAKVSFHAPGGGQVKGQAGLETGAPKKELLAPRAAVFQAGDKPASDRRSSSHETEAADVFQAGADHCAWGDLAATVEDLGEAGGPVLRAGAIDRFREPVGIEKERVAWFQRRGLRTIFADGDPARSVGQ